MVGNDMQNALAANYEALLLSYAIGALDQAQSLIVATHLALSPQARAFIRHCEAVGGALIEHDCAPVAMSSGALEHVLGCIGNPSQQKTHTHHIEETVLVFPEDLALPDLVLRSIHCRPCKPAWRSPLPGLKSYDLPLACKQSKSRLVKLEPAVQTPHHTHQGLEITLVLNGALSDDSGYYSAGDMLVSDEGIEHSQTACKKQGCVCMVVTSAPLRIGGLAGLINSFLRF